MKIATQGTTRLLRKYRALSLAAGLLFLFLFGLLAWVFGGHGIWASCGHQSIPALFLEKFSVEPQNVALTATLSRRFATVHGFDFHIGHPQPDQRTFILQLSKDDMEILVDNGSLTTDFVFGIYVSCDGNRNIGGAARAISDFEADVISKVKASLK